jgi:SAM-dependent methyltransferase
MGVEPISRDSSGDPRSGEWFGAWFDSPYYHRLYRNRDSSEARKLLDSLVKWLRLEPGAKVLDLACGRGRHAVALRARGFDVTGVDLSPSNIAYAQRFADDLLRFRVHDMRLPLGEPNRFDCVLNLFTSFGYFGSDAANILVLRLVADALRPGGILVLDYFNTPWVERTLVPEETKTIEGTTFHLTRRLHDGSFEKRIEFIDDEGQPKCFTERVMALRPRHFERAFAEAGLRLQAAFGDYELNPYDPHASPRQLYMVKKSDSEAE